MSEATVLLRRTIVVGAALWLSFTGAAPANAASEVADAAMHGDRTGLRLLLERSADVNAAQADGATALHWAVYSEDVEAVQLLLRAKADVSARNREGATPLSLACVNGDADDHRAAARCGCGRRRASADRRDDGDVRRAQLAATRRRSRLLIAGGADVECVRENVRGTTALMWAADQRHPEAVRMLLEVGADYSAQSGPAGGLPRNYMANPASTRERPRSGAAPGARRPSPRGGAPYQEQLEWEAANNVDLGNAPRLQSGPQPLGQTFRAAWPRAGIRDYSGHVCAST